MRNLQVRSALVGLVAVAASACGGGSSNGYAAPPSSPPPSTHSSVQLSVSSSLTNGETLTKPTKWRITADGAPLEHVDFFVDGRKLWSEANEPFFFNDDDQFLAPWLLGPGEHVLLARATTTTGETGETTSHVNVGHAPTVPNGLTGSFTRSVTQGDIDRTAKEPGREANAVLPPGRWAMKLDQGFLTFDDPLGSGGGEAFGATSSRLTMWGPPQWRLPKDRHGWFCEHEPPVTYTWTLSANTLVISGGGNCADRDALFVGTWTKRA